MEELDDLTLADSVFNPFELPPEPATPPADPDDVGDIGDEGSEGFPDGGEG